MAGSTGDDEPAVGGSGEDRRLRVALIGAGMVAPTHLAAIAGLADRVELGGVLARRPERAAALLADHADLVPPTARDYRSIDDLVGDGVDLAVVATPPDARRDLVAALAAGGVHLLVEKPLERTVAAAEDLCALAETGGVELGVVLQHRLRPAVTALRDLVATGRLGPLLACEASVPWWRPQSYYDQPGRGTYRRDGGGVLISQAIHTLDLLLSFTGPVAAVTAMTATTGFHGMEAEDLAVVGLELASGAVGSVLASTASFPGRPESIVLHHRNGSARLDGDHLTVSWHDGTVDTTGADTATGSGADPMAFTSDWHRAVLAGMVDAVTTGRRPVVTGRDALVVQRLIAAVETAAGTGRRTPVGDVPVPIHDLAPRHDPGTGPPPG